jgi:hypothetical protein
MATPTNLTIYGFPEEARASYERALALARQEPERLFCEAARGQMRLAEVFAGRFRSQRLKQEFFRRVANF